MAYFLTKNRNLGSFWTLLQWKMFVYFMDIWSILRPFDIFYGHFVYFWVIWSIFPRFGTLFREKYGNPGPELPCWKEQKRTRQVYKTDTSPSLT
jgi:hypothetical protein